MIVDEWNMLRNCFAADSTHLGEMRIERLGRPLDCIINPLCRLYDMQKDILIRHVRGSPNVVVKDRDESRMLTVGDNLVMFGGFSYNNSEFQDMKSTVVYNTVSGRLTRIPLNPKWETLPACAVPVSDTEFVTIEDVQDNDSQCSKKMIKHNIFNNDTVELPCMTNIMD